jgi:tetratricopeptide (TPR) repeat protein
MGRLRRLGSIAIVALASLGSAGCIKKILLEGQIASTRMASTAMNTVSDWDVAKRASSAGMAQFEGMHYLAPENADALFLLTKGWAGLGYAFIEDEMEQAQDQFGFDSATAEYHKQRAGAAYSRAVFYGIKLLEQEHPGFDAAKKNVESMKAWLAEFDDPAVDAENLFWVGQAWMSRVNVLKDQGEYVSELFVGVEMIRRSVELDENYNYASGHAVLGAYHARTAMAELDLSKEHFDKAIALTEGKALLAKLNLAARYYCTKVDKENYVKILQEVVAAGDILPEQRLQNTIAKRRALRYLQPSRMELCGF